MVTIDASVETRDELAANSGWPPKMRVKIDWETASGMSAIITDNVNTSGGSGNSVSPVSIISFPQRSDAGGTVVATHWSAGTAHTSTGKILYSGTVTPNISISQNVTPQLTTASTVTED